MRNKHLKPTIGDVFEIPTSAGKAYMQLTNYDEDGIELVRILPGLFPETPADLATLVSGPEVYFTFYFLTQSIKESWVAPIANFPIPEKSRGFPVMRQAGMRDREGRVHGWHIGRANIPLTVEGYRRLRFAKELTPEERSLSMRQIWGHALLVRNLLRDWRPERAEELDAIARAEEEANAPRLESKSEYLDHYFFFPKKSAARAIAKRLRAKGWFAEVSRIAEDRRDWLTLAKQPAPIKEDIGDLRDELEALAEEFGGEYDGWGAAI